MGKLWGKNIGQRNKKKVIAEAIWIKLYNFVQYKIKQSFDLRCYSCIFFINAFSLMTRIRGSTRKQSVRSQFRKVHIHIYLYIYQVAEPGTWSEAVNSSEGDRAFSEASAANTLPQALNLNRNLITLYPKRKTCFFEAAMIYTNSCRTVNIAVRIFALSASMNLVLSADGPTPAAERWIYPSPRQVSKGPAQELQTQKGARDISVIEKQFF